MDNAHSHPSSSVPRARPRSLREYHGPSITPPPPNRQQRLLRNRHEKFPAKKLSISGISARFSQIIRTNEAEAHMQTPLRPNQENNTYRTLNTPSDFALSPSPLGILNELNGSLGRNTHRLRRKEAVEIFEDTPERSLLAESPLVSPLLPRDLSSEVGSPWPFDHIQDSVQAMNLREISGNAQKSSPFASLSLRASTKKHPPRKSAKSLSQFDPTDYIEHLERELQQAKEAIVSPNTNVPWSTKWNVSKSANHRLQKENLELKAGFEIELQKTVELMTATEIDLRRKIRTLEEMIEHKDYTIQELELQHDEKRLDQSTIDTLKATIEKLERENKGLEETNQSISKRNEVLTHLLAMSPTKATSFELGTPRQHRRSTRPKSLLIGTVPSSPVVSGSRRPMSLVVTPGALASTGYFSPNGSSSANSPNMEPNDSPNMAVSEDSAIEISQGTSSPSFWGASNPISPPPGNRPIQQPSRRRTRKFMSGSTQLKPLLLPVLTGESDNTSTASDHTHTDTESEHSSGNNVAESYRSGNSFSLHRRILVETDSNPLLDRKKSCLHVNDTAEARIISPIHAKDSIEPTAWCSSPLSDLNDRLLQSLGHEIANAEFPAAIDNRENSISDSSNNLSGYDSLKNFDYSTYVPQPLFTRSTAALINQQYSDDQKQPRAYSDCDTPTDSRKRRKLSLSENVMSSTNRDESPSPIGTPIIRGRRMLTPASQRNRVERRRSRSKKPLQKANLPQESPKAIESLPRRRLSNRPLAAVTIRRLYGTLSKYTQYIIEFKRDPLALARRVITNAWLTKWTMFGQLSWWVLGLFLSPRPRSDPNSCSDWDQYDGESIALRHCSAPNDESSTQSNYGEVTGQSRSATNRSRYDDNKDDNNKNRRLSRHVSSRHSQKTKEFGLGQSILLWGKFSLAIFLALSGAVIQGPGEMLRDIDHQGRRKSHQWYGGSRRPSYSARNSQPAKAPDPAGSQANDLNFCVNNDANVRPTMVAEVKETRCSTLCTGCDNTTSGTVTSTHMRKQVSQDDNVNRISDSPAFTSDHDPGGFDADETLRPMRSERGALSHIFTPPPSDVNVAKLNAVDYRDNEMASPLGS